jgi:hypothetical protein
MGFHGNRWDFVPNGGIAGIFCRLFVGPFFSCSTLITLWISLWSSESRIAQTGKLSQEGIKIMPAGPPKLIDIK